MIYLDYGFKWMKLYLWMVPPHNLKTQGLNITEQKLRRWQQKNKQ
jgi:hypothetical protein